TLEPNLKGNDIVDRRLAWYLDGLDPGSRAAAIHRIESSGTMSGEERFRLVQLYDLAGDTDASARNRDRILAEQAETPAMLAHFIRTLVQRGRADDAEPLLERLRQMEPTSPRTAAFVKMHVGQSARLP